MYATYLWTEDPFDITEFKINIIEIIYPSKKKSIKWLEFYAVLISVKKNVNKILH